MTKPIIEVTNLERTFGSNRAVDGITFRVEQGEVFGLLGPNGAGKTTCVRLLNGILPPSGGTMRVFGFDLALESALLGLLMLTTVSFVPFWLWLSRRTNKRSAYLAGMIFWVVTQPPQPGIPFRRIHPQRAK